MELNVEELNSALWKKIRAHHELKLQSLRKLNDQLNMPGIETQTVRGKIATHKEMLRLDPEWKE